MTDSPLISVIMNCYNGEKYLREAIDSVVAQTYSNWEIIFWDNASTDRSAEIAQSYDDRLRYFRGDETIPLGAARNKALELAGGELISVLDCDDVWVPHKLNVQVQFFQENEDVSFLYSNAWMRTPSSRRHLLYSKEKKMPSGDIFRSLLKNNFINLQTVMFRKKLIVEMDQWFDPELEITEEYDLFLRMVYGKTTAYLSMPLAEYRIHHSMNTILKFSLIPNELERILKKLHCTVPHLSRMYSGELRFYEGRIALREITQYLLDGDRANAIARCEPYKLLSIKYFGLYVLMKISTKIALLAILRKNFPAYKV